MLIVQDFLSLRTSRWSGPLKHWTGTGRSFACLMMIYRWIKVEFFYIYTFFASENIFWKCWIAGNCWSCFGWTSWNCEGTRSAFDWLCEPKDSCCWSRKVRHNQASKIVTAKLFGCFLTQVYPLHGCSAGLGVLNMAIQAVSRISGSGADPHFFLLDKDVWYSQHIDFFIPSHYV